MSGVPPNPPDTSSGDQRSFAAAWDLAVLAVLGVIAIVTIVILVGRRDDQVIAISTVAAILLLTAATAIALIIVGMLHASRESPSTGNYLARDLAEAQARRRAIAGVSLALLGVVLLGTTLVVGTSSAVEVVKANATPAPAATPVASDGGSSSPDSGG